MPFYTLTIYQYDDPAAAVYRALFPDRTGAYIGVVSGANSTLDSGDWMLLPDSLFIGLWELRSFVYEAYGADGERVFLLAELKKRL